MENEIRRTAGGIVIGDGGMVAMVKSSRSQSWLFPKGGIDTGEDDETAARREIREEAGLDDLEYIDDLGTFVRPAPPYETAYPEKSMHMFLFAAPRGAMPTPSMEVLEARWVPYREVPTTLGTPHADWFAADRAWFASVFDRVREAIQRD